MKSKWKTIRHEGPLFPPEYVHMNFKIYVCGKKIVLDAYHEEYAYYWAQKINTPYVKDEVFQKNFWLDFKKDLSEELQSTNFPADWNFDSIVKYIELLKEHKKNKSKEQKKAIVKEKEILKKKYGIAIVDNDIEMELGNYVIEPPGLFMGRGNHPSRGRFKLRVQPEDVTIVTGENKYFPNPPRGHNWKAIEQKSGVLFTAYWTENVLGNRKTIAFSRASTAVQEKEKEKFAKAQKLANNFDKIDAKIDKGILSKNETERAVATVCKLIRVLGIRVGDEKDPDLADTRGATTLCCENVKIDGNNITFDFLGKDSVRYLNTVEFDANTVASISKFMQNKKPEQRIFPDIDSSDVRNFLSSIIPGLSAKVFRTATASAMLSETLKELDLTDKTEKQKIYEFQQANLQVAKKLNHQTAVSKTHDETVEKMKKQLQEMKEKNTEFIANNELDKSAKLTARINDLINKIDMKEQTKNVSLGTSKQNYISPLLVASWAKANNVNIEKIYTKALVKKFKWAMNADKDYYKGYVK